MANTGAGDNNIFWQVENIHIADIHHQAHGYFGVPGNGNIGNQLLPKPFVLSALHNLANSAQLVQNF